MKFNYFDSSISGKRARARKYPDESELVTFSPFTGRIYFSAGAVQRFKLDENRVTFVQGKDDPKDLFLYIDNERGFVLTSYRWTYYVNSKRSVEETMDRFMGQVQNEPLRFRALENAEVIDGRKMYRLEIHARKVEEKKLIGSEA